MNKRLLSKLMHERVEGLLHSKNYFFRGDFENVLMGVLFEYVSKGLYIWNFRFPLFDFAGPNLLYSDRFYERSGFIGKTDMSEEAVVDFVLASPEARSAFGSVPMDTTNFVHFLEKRGLRNPHVRFIHAAALVLLGEESRATSLLDKLVSDLHPTDIANCNLLRTKLQVGGAAEARGLLEKVRRENLKTFAIVS